MKENSKNFDLTDGSGVDFDGSSSTALDGYYYEMQQSISPLMQRLSIGLFSRSTYLAKQLKVLIRESKILEDLPEREYSWFHGSVQRTINSRLNECEEIVDLLVLLERDESQRTLQKDSALGKILRSLEGLNYVVNHAYQFKKTGRLIVGSYRPAYESYAREGIQPSG